MHTNFVHICTSIHPVLQLLLICSSPWRGATKYEGNAPYFGKVDQQYNSHRRDIMVGADGGGDYQTRAVALKSWCTYLLPSANNLSNLHFAILLWQNKPKSLQSKTSSKNQNFDAKPHFRLRTNQHSSQIELLCNRFDMKGSILQLFEVIQSTQKDPTVKWQTEKLILILSSFPWQSNIKQVVAITIATILILTMIMITLLMIIGLTWGSVLSFLEWGTLLLWRAWGRPACTKWNSCGELSKDNSVIWGQPTRGGRCPIWFDSMFEFCRKMIQLNIWFNSWKGW